MQDDPKTSPYAPVRLRDVYWWKYHRQLAERGIVTADGKVKPNFFDTVSNELIVPITQAGRNVYPEGGPPESEEAYTLLAAQAFSHHAWGALVGQFHACGRQLFDLADGLVDTLAHTDVKDATMDGLELPYPAFYVRLGKQEDARLDYVDDEGNQSEFLDGFFVASAPFNVTGERGLRFGFTTILENGRGMKAPGYFLDFEPEDLTLPSLDAVDAALARQLVRSEDLPHDGLRAAARIRVREAGKLLKDAMPLILSALFYLDNLGKDESDLSPGRDTPPDTLKKWHAATGNKRRKVGSAMTSEGYTLVHLIGKEYDDNPSMGPRGRSAPGWVRGHWKMQPYGPRSSLRKRIRIAPRFHNPTNAPIGDVPGHVYVP